MYQHEIIKKYETTKKQMKLSRKHNLWRVNIWTKRNTTPFHFEICCMAVGYDVCWKIILLSFIQTKYFLISQHQQEGSQEWRCRVYTSLIFCTPPLGVICNRNLSLWRKLKVRIWKEIIFLSYESEMVRGDVWCFVSHEFEWDWILTRTSTQPILANK